MNVRSLFAPLAAAIALSASPALAQHEHAAPSGAAAGIAEGTVKGGVRVIEMKVTDEGQREREHHDVAPFPAPAGGSSLRSFDLSSSQGAGQAAATSARSRDRAADP